MGYNVELRAEAEALILHNQKQITLQKKFECFDLRYNDYCNVVIHESFEEQLKAYKDYVLNSSAQLPAGLREPYVDHLKKLDKWLKKHEGWDIAFVFRH